MSRFLPIPLLMIFLAACSSGYGSAPSNLDDACSIIRERPSYLRAMKATERNWGVSIPVQMAIIYQESKFISNNRTPMRYALGIIPMGRQSSAFGYAQALDGTWEEYQREEGGSFARRTDISDATDFIGWYLTKTENAIGISRNDIRNQYLAYHEGRTGYSRGSYRGKTWLLRIANEITDRSQTYANQLRACGKI